MKHYADAMIDNMFEHTTAKECQELYTYKYPKLN